VPNARTRLILQNVILADDVFVAESPKDVCIENGRVTKIAPAHSLAGEAGTRVLPCEGLIAVPGLVDVHVHFREPGATQKEDIASGSRAAAAGGYTSVCCMPNTKPAVDSVATLCAIDQKGRETGMVHVFQTAAMTLGQSGDTLVPLRDMDATTTLCKELTGHGVAGVTEDGRSLMDETLMRQVSILAKELNLPVMDHAEDVSLVGGCMHEGEISAQLGLPGLPSEAEANIVRRDIRLAEETGAHFHLQHISAASSVALIREAKKRLSNLTAETAPHYFALTDSDVVRLGTMAKMNPPVRTEEDRLAIIEGLKDGTIDMIATDHAPHTEAEKAKPMESAPFGIVGLETGFSLGYTRLVRGGYLTLPQLIGKMCAAPSRLIGLPYETIREGMRADIMIFAPKENFVVRSEDFFSKGRNTPFEGETLFGRIRYTVLGGGLSYEYKE
jgi:dihydroorotase